jgi:hypothetical protein
MPNGHPADVQNLDTHTPDDWPADGIYTTIASETYHDLEDRASSSILRTIVRKTPSHAKARMDEDVEPTRAMRFGTRFHELVLEPEAFQGSYAVKGQCAALKSNEDRCTYSGKHAVQAIRWSEELDERFDDPQAAFDVPEIATEVLWFCGNHAPAEIDVFAETVEGNVVVRDHDVETIREDDMEQMQAMEASLRDHSAARKLLWEWPGTEELSVLWTHKATEVPCKSRIDRLVMHPQLGRVAVDLKTAYNAQPGPHEFGRDAASGGYHLQGAMYLDALASQGVYVDHYIIVAVEKSPPFAASAFLLPHELLEEGRDKIAEALRTFRECRDTGEWWGYPESVVQLEVPHWERDPQ